MEISALSAVNSVNTKHSMPLSGRGRNAYLLHPDKRGIWRGHLLPGHKGIDVSRFGIWVGL